MTSRRRFLLVTLAALALAAATARLGVWQLDRAERKTALQHAVDERGRLPPLAPGELAVSGDQALAQHHRRVRIEGRWSAAHTVFLDNRQMNGRPGFFVVTPLVLADGRAVLVQRGWLPRDFTDRSRVAAVATPDGLVVAQGRIAPSPARLYEFDAAATGPIRQNLAIDAFARETGLALAPVSVLQLEGPSDGLLRQWPAPAFDVHRNEGYAFQWFALSALTLALYAWFQLIRPRLVR